MRDVNSVDKASRTSGTLPRRPHQFLGHNIPSIQCVILTLCPRSFLHPPAVKIPVPDKPVGPEKRRHVPTLFPSEAALSVYLHTPPRDANTNLRGDQAGLDIQQNQPPDHFTNATIDKSEPVNVRSTSHNTHASGEQTTVTPGNHPTLHTTKRKNEEHHNRPRAKRSQT